MKTLRFAANASNLSKSGLGIYVPLVLGAQTYWCRNCSVEWDQAEENIRRESKISVPDRNVEPAVATTPSIDEHSVAIRHEPEIKGALKDLKDKGLKIIHYEEHIPKSSLIGGPFIRVCIHMS